MTSETESAVLKNYYSEHDFILSPEGILKVLSIILCIISAVLFLGGAGATCGSGAGGLAGGAATVAIVCAAATALLYAGQLCSVPLLAPTAWLYLDIVMSTVMGVLLLVTAILSITLCRMSSAVDYMHGPLAIVNAGTVTASGVVQYVAVMRRWDAARGPVREPRRPPSSEQDA